MGLIAFAALLALAVAGCSADESSNDTIDEPTGTTSTVCDRAFSDAASIGDMEGTVEDLEQAILVCRSVDEWIAASEANPDALDGVDPVVYLTNSCLYATDPDIAQTALCKSLG